jgi:hopanoid C-3 methylase
MKVLLIQPPLCSNFFANKSYIPEPLAYEILASTIPHHDVKILDMRLKGARLSGEIESFRPDVVGAGCVTAGYYECIKVLQETKALNPEIITIVGGHHPSVIPQDFAKDFIDFIVIGEGERTFQELIESLELKRNGSAVKGLAIPKDGSLLFTGERHLIDINEMPNPRRDLTSKYRNHYFRGTWRPIACIVGSRGCSFRCTFCCQWILNRGKYRVRAPESVVNELAKIGEPFVIFVDDNSWEDFEWVEQLYFKIKDACIKKNYQIYARSDLIVRRPLLIERWREIGLKAVLVGFESFRDDHLKKLNKGCTVDKNTQAAQILKANGVGIIGYFMIDPLYTEGDFSKLIEYVHRLDIDQPIFSILTPFPGTNLYKQVKDQLITDNYEYFDGMHSVITTAISGPGFYRCYRKLYSKAYPKGKLIRKMLQGKISFSFVQAFYQKKYLKQLRPVDS